MTNWDDIAAEIGNATQARFIFARATPVGGGDINRSDRLEGRDGRRYFVKLNEARRAAMFEAERVGLDALAATRTVRVAANASRPARSASNIAARRASFSFTK